MLIKLHNGRVTFIIFVDFYQRNSTLSSFFHSHSYRGIPFSLERFGGRGQQESIVSVQSWRKEASSPGNPIENLTGILVFKLAGETEAKTSPMGRIPEAMMQSEQKLKAKKTCEIEREMIHLRTKFEDELMQSEKIQVIADEMSKMHHSCDSLRHITGGCTHT